MLPNTAVFFLFDMHSEAIYHETLRSDMDRQYLNEFYLGYTCDVSFVFV